MGGGISGISAALELSHSQPACWVELYEAGPRLGGVLETIQDGPYLIERSADNFATLIPDALELTRTYGDEQQLIQPLPVNRRAFVLHRGRLMPIPVGFSLMQPTQLWSVISSGILSWKGKLRLLAECLVPRRREDGDESLESFAVRRLGKEAYQNLVEPIVSGIFTADPTRLSMQATMPQFLKMEQKHGSLIRAHWAARKTDATAAARRASGARYDQFLAPRYGMSDWIRQLIVHLPAESVHLSTPVHSVERDSTGWSLATGGGATHFDAVILATPAATTAELLKSSMPAAAALVASIPYASSVVVAMIVPKSELRGRIDGFGMISPSQEKRPTLAISYTSNKYSGRVPDDQILLRLFFGGALHPSMIQRSDSDLIALAHQELHEILGWTGEQPIWQAVIRWPNSMPQYTLGHCERMDRLQQILSYEPTLQLCGAAYRGVGIPQCVRGGRTAARQILASLSEQ